MPQTETSPLSTKIVSLGTNHNIKMFYRAGTKEEKSSDENAIKEVITRKSYTKVRSNFDVQPGECWLDLGANIGAFAMYCRMKRATAVCYEPDPENFKILKLNAPGFELHCEAVSGMKEKTLVFKKSPNPLNHYRGTIVSAAPGRYIDGGIVKNKYAGFLRNQTFDGVKMDIEGAEMLLLDNWLLPKCKKLVLEYHTSRDAGVQPLADRLKAISDRFEHMKYPKVFDDIIDGSHTGEWPPRFDQLIFAWRGI